ncbi:hypothetical protein D3C83_134640 [compost metagenome]
MSVFASSIFCFASFCLRSSSSYNFAFSIAIASARLRCCERSFCDATTMLVGRWVMRTAESVLFTCCPPAPEAR